MPAATFLQAMKVVRVAYAFFLHLFAGRSSLLNQKILLIKNDASKDLFNLCTVKS